MRANPSNLEAGADAGRGVGEIMSGPAAVRDDPTGPAGRQVGRAVLKGILSLSLSVRTGGWSYV
jgi:hypothetical protein